MLLYTSSIYPCTVRLIAINNPNRQLASNRSVSASSEASTPSSLTEVLVILRLSRVNRPASSHFGPNREAPAVTCVPRCLSSGCGWYLSCSRWISRSAKTIFDWARDSSDSCGFLAFVRWDLMSRVWLGLLTQDVRTRLGVCSCRRTWTPATSSRPSGCCVWSSRVKEARSAARSKK